MSQSKLDKVKELINKSESQINDTQSAQEAYTRRLEKGIETTKALLDKAEDAVTQMKFNQKSFISEKEKIVALYTSYKKIPYVSDKDDVIDIATASILTRRARKAHDEVVKELKKQNEIDDAKIESKSDLMNDYESISVNLTEAIERNEHRRKELETVPMDSTLDDQQKNLEKMLQEASKIEKLLSLHLKRVIVKHLAMSDWEGQSITDEDVLKQRVTEYTNLLQLLINSHSWVSVDHDTYNSSFVRAMRVNGLVKFKTEHNTYYLKLRNFGYEFPTEVLYEST